jgi:hypothetical protein
MNDNIKKSNLSKSDIITASEIGQYQFCSISWKLHKCGYKPNAINLKKGKKIHNSHGRLMDNIKEISRNSEILKIIGYFLFFIGIFIMIFEVIF